MESGKPPAINQESVVPVVVHDLRGMDHGSVYDETQCSDDVKHGDVLLVDGGVAILDRAWPIMVVGTSRELHMLAQGMSWPMILDRPETSSARRLQEGLLVALALALQ